MSIENRQAQAIDRLTHDLTEANERVTYWMDAHAKDCAELQDIRNHLSLALAQRNEELLQAKAEATRYREAMVNVLKQCQKTTFNDCGELRAKVYDIAYEILNQKGGE